MKYLIILTKIYHTVIIMIFGGNGLPYTIGLYYRSTFKFVVIHGKFSWKFVVIHLP